MEETKGQAELKAQNTGMVSDFTTTPSGKQVYDVGETVVAKMNREKAVFDKDEFFQDLYENFLVCVQNNNIRQKPHSGIVLHWNPSDSFDDFMSDSLDNIDRQIDSIKFAKAVGAQKISALDGDFFLSAAKIAPGSEAVKKKFGTEDYDAIYEILRKAKETIIEYRTGKIQMIVNSKTGRVRITKGTGI